MLSADISIDAKQMSHHASLARSTDAESGSAGFAALPWRQRQPKWLSTSSSMPSWDPSALWKRLRRTQTGSRKCRTCALLAAATLPPPSHNQKSLELLAR